MVDIPNTEYITVNPNGIFVGGKPATTYRGVRIHDKNYVKDTFALIQEQNPNITELHVMSSKTRGEFAEVGNPSFEHGRYAWCRVKYKNGNLGGWVFDDALSSATNCATYCALSCAYNVRAYAAFRRAVLSAAFDNGQNGENARSDDLNYIDWSKYQGEHKVGLYRIIVEKVGPKTK